MSTRNMVASARQRARRTQAVHIRHEDEVSAMSWTARFKTRLRNTFEPEEIPTSSHHGSNNNINTNADVERPATAADELPPSPPKIQYCLQARRRYPERSCLHRILTCNGFFSRDTTYGLPTVGINPNERLALYLHWMFRVNFLFLFVVMCTIFFALVILFSGFITLAGTMDGMCVRIGGEPFASNGSAFADAFALSWTTFSTVGYGSTAPALGHQNDSETYCFFINFILSLESLLGVLYSGFCGAILFGKVLRIQSHAQVLFSDPVVIRFGSGVTQQNAEFSDDSDNDGQSTNNRQVPCPVLEFRIVNRLFNEIGGEIMDATLNVVANVDANETGDPLDAADIMSSIAGFTSAADSSSDTSSVDTSSMAMAAAAASSASSASGSHHPLRNRVDLKDSLQRVFHLGHQSQSQQYQANNAPSFRQQAIDEDPSARLVSKQVFSKMTIEASDHPFFKRVWLARHVLDENSPILKPRVRKYIAKLHGAWPERMCTAQHVRDALQFNQILVSLAGVSNVSASDVYAQKIYDFVDINVGYQFVNILYRDGDGGLGVDTDLINDVREQAGGGGETLISKE